MSDSLENARRAVVFDPVQLALGTEQATWAREMYRAVMLATDLETLLALLDGEAVPLERLDPEWVERFGRRGE